MPRTLALFLLALPVVTEAADLYPTLDTYLEARVAEFDAIPADRRERLEQLARFVREARADGREAKLTFICTHNSRRSHLSQFFAQVAAARYAVAGVQTYSGGTETTAFNPRAIAAMRRAGFDIREVEPGENPVYEVRWADGDAPLRGYSKVYDEAPNPARDFAAVMTCSQADETCPVVLGSRARVVVPYVDPKVSDGTPEESATYDERAAQIAREMLYVFSRAAAPDASFAGSDMP